MRIPMYDCSLKDIRRWLNSVDTNKKSDEIKVLVNGSCDILFDIDEDGNIQIENIYKSKETNESSNSSKQDDESENLSDEEMEEIPDYYKDLIDTRKSKLIDSKIRRKRRERMIGDPHDVDVDLEKLQNAMFGDYTPPILPPPPQFPSSHYFEFEIKELKWQQKKLKKEKKKIKRMKKELKKMRQKKDTIKNKLPVLYNYTTCDLPEFETMNDAFDTITRNNKITNAAFPYTSRGWEVIGFITNIVDVPSKIILRKPVDKNV